MKITDTIKQITIADIFVRVNDKEEKLKVLDLFSRLINYPVGEKVLQETKVGLGLEYTDIFVNGGIIDCHKAGYCRKHSLPIAEFEEFCNKNGVYYPKEKKVLTFYYPKHGDGELVQRTVTVDEETDVYILGKEGNLIKKFLKSKISKRLPKKKIIGTAALSLTPHSLSLQSHIPNLKLKSPCLSGFKAAFPNLADGNYTVSFYKDIKDIPSNLRMDSIKIVSGCINEVCYDIKGRTLGFFNAYVPGDLPSNLSNARTILGTVCYCTIEAKQ